MVLKLEDPGVEVFQGLNLSRLQVDEAYVTVTSQLDKDAYLYSLSDDCFTCLYELVGGASNKAVVPAHSNDTSHVFKTHHGWSFRLASWEREPPRYLSETNNTGLLCDVHGEMGEFGVYHLTTTPGDAGDVNCDFATTKEPVSIYWILLIAFGFYFGVALLWTLFKFIWTRIMRARKNRVDIDELGMSQANGIKPPDAESKSKQKQRLKSLDMFRGLSIIIMVFVNYQGGSFWFFEHATWNGLLVADLVFPWFMWIMGMCIPMSVRSQLRRNVPKWKIFLRIFKRFCILFMLGIILNTFGGWLRVNRLRIPGVLQRLAISYLVTATLMTIFGRAEYEQKKGKIQFALQDVIYLWPEWIFMLLVVVAHCLVTFMLEVPGCPTGYLGPGGKHMDGQFWNCTGGAAGYIDRLALTTNHIYNWPTARRVYGSLPYDPEGILGCLTCIFQVFLGAQAGMTLQMYKNWKCRISRWLVWGVLTAVIGTILCKGSQNDGWIPVNKNLWSLSFVLITTSFALFLLSFCYFVSDVKKWWSGAPLYMAGMNSILIYCGHGITSNLFPWNYDTGNMNTHWSLLVENLWGTTLWVLISIWLYRKKFFLTI